MTREDLICYGKIITKIFCGFFFPPLLFLLLVIQEFLLFFGGNPSFMLKIRGIFCFSFSSVSGLVLWFVAWMEANQALKALATHCQKWHSGSALKLLSRTSAPVQWLRGHEQQLRMFCAQFSPGFTLRACSKITEWVWKILATFSVCWMRYWAVMCPWRSGRCHQVWVLQMAEVSAPKFSPDRKPFVESSSEGFGCIPFNFVFPFSSLLVGMVAINKQVAGNFASAKMENWILFLIQNHQWLSCYNFKTNWNDTLPKQNLVLTAFVCLLPYKLLCQCLYKQSRLGSSPSLKKIYPILN